MAKSTKTTKATKATKRADGPKSAQLRKIREERAKRDEQAAKSARLAVLNGGKVPRGTEPQRAAAREETKASVSALTASLSRMLGGSKVAKASLATEMKTDRPSVPPTCEAAGVASPASGKRSGPLTKAEVVAAVESFGKKAGAKVTLSSAGKKAKAEAKAPAKSKGGWIELAPEKEPKLVRAGSNLAKLLELTAAKGGASDAELVKAIKATKAGDGVRYLRYTLARDRGFGFSTKEVDGVLRYSLVLPAGTKLAFKPAAAK